MIAAAFWPITINRKIGLGLVLNSTRDLGGIFCTESRQLKSADVYARACGVTAGNFIIIIVLAVERYGLNSGP
jgi:hypothetical protein